MSLSCLPETALSVWADTARLMQRSQILGSYVCQAPSAHWDYLGVLNVGVGKRETSSHLTGG